MPKQLAFQGCIGRAQLWGGGGGSKQLKIPPWGGCGRGCKISYIFVGGWVRATWKPLATPLLLVEINQNYQEMPN